MLVHARVSPVEFAQILALRELYRQEMNCQIIHDSLHRRGFNESYLIEVEGRVAGYGTMTSGNDERRVFERGILNEYYILPRFRGQSVPIFRELLAVSQANQIMAQSNDLLLTLMLYDFAEQITSDRILFSDAITTDLSLPGVIFRAAAGHEADNDWLLEAEGVIAAKGGVTTHYNPPYGDIYMGVEEPYRRRGYGSYLVQELKRVCYESGRKPAARCNADNIASRHTLQKAGLLPCGRMLQGRVRIEGKRDDI